MSAKGTICACFFDLENISVNQEMVQQVLSKLKKHGLKPDIRIAVSSSPRSTKVKKCLEAHQIQLLTTEGHGRNAADFRIVIEIMRMLHENPQIGTIAIVSNDHGFVEVIHELKKQNKRVVVITMPGTKQDNAAAKLADVHMVIDPATKQNQTTSQTKTDSWKILPELEDLLNTIEHLPENERKNYIAAPLYNNLLQKQVINKAEKQAILECLRQNGIQYRPSSKIMKKLKAA